MSDRRILWRRIERVSRWRRVKPLLLPLYVPLFFVVCWCFLAYWLWELTCKCKEIEP